MNKIKLIQGGVCSPIGFKAAGIHCGIRKNKSKLDLGMIYSDTACNTAAVYTSNKVFGAPITVTREHLTNGYAKAVICNSGNANTCNADGVLKANMMCQLAAQALNIDASDVVVASTGVIGQTLPIEPISASMDKLVSELSVDRGESFATAIMTTDTYKKEFAVEFVIDGLTCRIGAVAKGSGMIQPNMATMLCFITTDVAIASDVLKVALKSVVADTINMVSVDGDTSTNDMMTIMANGLAGNVIINSVNSPQYKIFVNNLYAIAEEVARNLARDGEGATKLVECHVSSAKSKKVARIIAKSVIMSNLLKCALFAADANWGRILCAIGYAKADFDIDKVDVTLKSSKGEVAVCKNGSGVQFSEEVAHEILMESKIIIAVDLHSGVGKAVAYGCDLTYEYVKINADYRS